MDMSSTNGTNTAKMSSTNATHVVEMLSNNTTKTSKLRQKNTTIVMEMSLTNATNAVENVVNNNQTNLTGSLAPSFRAPLLLNQACCSATLLHIHSRPLHITERF